MKKFTAIFLTVMLTLAAAGTGISAFAAGTAGVYVTICDNTGKMQLTQQHIDVTDTDNDGSLTVKDALYTAHEKYYPGGAHEGFAASYSLEWGWSLSKLWGQTNNGSFGYYINNRAANSLTDKLSDGDYLNAFCYTDSKYFTDVYSYFNVCSTDVAQFGSTSLTLSYYTYDYTTWKLIPVFLSNAEITVDGEKTGVTTDENGMATLTFNKAGNHTVSAVSGDKLIIAPVCTVNVTQAGILARVVQLLRILIALVAKLFNR